MNNGQIPHSESQALSLISNGLVQVITPEDYAQNQERIASYRAQLARLEQQNEIGLRRFRDQEQELRRLVEEGRQAQRLLDQFQNARAASADVTPVPGPSTGMPAQQPSMYYPGPYANQVPPPSSASIVDVSSPPMQQPNSGMQSSSHRSVQQPRPSQIDNISMTRQQQVPIQGWRQYGQHSEYQDPSQVHQAAQAYSFRDYVPRPSRAPQPPQTPQQPPPLPTQPQQMRYQPNITRTSTDVSADHQAVMTSTSSALNGALGPLPNSGGVSHSNTTYSFNAARPAVPIPGPSGMAPAVPLAEARIAETSQKIIKLLQDLRRDSVKYIIAVVFQRLTGLSPEDPGNNEKATQSIHFGQRIHTQSELTRLQEISDSVVREFWNMDRLSTLDILKKVTLDVFKPSGQPAANMPFQSFPSRESASQVPPSVSTANPSQPLHLTSGHPSGSSNYPVPAGSSQTTIILQPMDDSNGQIRSEHRSSILTPDQAVQQSTRQPEPQRTILLTPRNHASLSASVSSAVLSTPPRTSMNGKEKKAQWTPDKADKSRLARDIMRSLRHSSHGLPTAVPRRPMPSPEDAAESTKRRRTSESPQEAVKKQKMDDVTDVDAEIKTHGALERECEELITGASGRRYAAAGPSAIPMESTVVENNASDVGQDPIAGAMLMAQSDASGPPTSKSASPAPPLAAQNMPFSAVVDGLLPSAREAILPFQSSPNPRAAQFATSPLPGPSPSHSSSEVKQPISSPARATAHDFIEIFDSSDEDTSEVHPTAASLGRHESPCSPSKSEREPATSALVKTPLFLPSPSSSHGGFEDDPSHDPSATDQDGAAGQFVLRTNFLAVAAPATGSSPQRKDKGKGKERTLWDSDEGMEIIRSSAKNVARHDSGTSSGSGRAAASRSYVLVPPRPNWVKRMKAMEARRQAGLSENDSMEVDELVDDDEEQRREAELQTEAVQLSYTRLRESPCLWRGCGALLNSRSRLQEHAMLHAGERDSFKCEWQYCARMFSDKAKLAQHLKTHVSALLFCAYQDCDKSFPMSRELLQHHNSNRHRVHNLRPAAMHLEHADPALRPLPRPLPEELPSYMTVPVRVTPCAMSKEEHARLSARVLEDISMYHYSGRRMHAGARSSRRMQKRIAAVERLAQDPAVAQALLRRMSFDEYETIASRPRRAAKRCDDIPSGEITRLCDEGLVIWPTIDGQESPELDMEMKAEPPDQDLAGDDHPLGDVGGAVQQHDEEHAAEGDFDAIDARLADGASRDQSKDGDHVSERAWTALNSMTGADEAAVESLL